MDTLITWVGLCIVPVCTALMGMFTYKIQRRDKLNDDMDRNAKDLDAISGTVGELSKTVGCLVIETQRQAMGLRILLRASMHEDYKEIMRQGFVSSNRLRDFQEAYHIYHIEGGNGTATRWLHDLMALPIKEEGH